MIINDIKQQINYIDRLNKFLESIGVNNIYLDSFANAKIFNKQDFMNSCNDLIKKYEDVEILYFEDIKIIIKELFIEGELSNNNFIISDCNIVISFIKELYINKDIRNKCFNIISVYFTNKERNSIEMECPF